MKKRTLFPTRLRKSILKQLDTARKSKKFGAVTAIYNKYGIASSYEAQWRKAEERRETNRILSSTTVGGYAGTEMPSCN